MTRIKRSNYELSRSQVDTPAEVVRLAWELVRRRRSRIGNVLDLGAGDGRFALSSKYATYTGVEIDRRRTRHIELPSNAKMHVGCAFAFKGSNFELCIGNPPYVRHHDLEEKWRDKTAASLSEIMGIRINRKANLYVYFLALALLKTSADGLICLVVPLEWTIRPSAEGLRKYIKDQKWSVDVFRFTGTVFADVDTSASIAIVDKRKRTGEWKHYDVAHGAGGSFAISPAVSTEIVPYEQRGKIWALRGMSPGTQDIFTLSEGERIHAGLRRDDVMPCVTTMRHVSHGLITLDDRAFNLHYVSTGYKCWLIKSHVPVHSERLQVYLRGIPKAQRDTWTCNTRKPWHRYIAHPIPGLLISTGLSTSGPKIMVNKIGAHAVGAVCGIHSSEKQVSFACVGKFIDAIDFSANVFSHSGTLRKIEIRQINAVLNQYKGQESP